jgi:hypothetical protein
MEQNSLTPYVKETTGIELIECPTTLEAPTACIDHALMRRIVQSVNPPILTNSETTDAYLIDTKILFSESGISDVLTLLVLSAADVAEGVLIRVVSIG